MTRIRCKSVTVGGRCASTGAAQGITKTLRRQHGIAAEDRRDPIATSRRSCQPDGSERGRGHSALGRLSCKELGQMKMLQVVRLIDLSSRRPERRLMGEMDDLSAQRRYDLRWAPIVRLDHRHAQTGGPRRLHSIREPGPQSHRLLDLDHVAVVPENGLQPVHLAHVADEVVPLASVSQSREAVGELIAACCTPPDVPSEIEHQGRRAPSRCTGRLDRATRCRHGGRLGAGTVTLTEYCGTRRRVASGWGSKSAYHDEFEECGTGDLVMGERYGSLWRTFARVMAGVLTGIGSTSSRSTGRSTIGSSPRTLARLAEAADPRARLRNEVLLVGLGHSDIVMNPAAPLVTDGVPIERIGAVDESRFLLRPSTLWPLRGSGEPAAWG